MLFLKLSGVLAVIAVTAVEATRPDKSGKDVLQAQESSSGHHDVEEEHVSSKCLPGQLCGASLDGVDAGEVVLDPGRRCCCCPGQNAQPDQCAEGLETGCLARRAQLPNWGCNFDIPLGQCGVGPHVVVELGDDGDNAELSTQDTSFANSQP